MIFSQSGNIEIIPFPALRGHHGAACGNGCLGLLIWGEKRTLRISIGCCALWDHNGEIDYPEEFTMQSVKAALQNGDDIFLRNCAGARQIHAPTMLPAGRLEIELPEGCCLMECQLPADSGKAVVKYKRQDNSYGTLEILPGRGEDLCNIFVVKNIELFSKRLIAAQTLNTDGFFNKNHYDAAEYSANGFIQKIPGCGGYALNMVQNQDLLTVQLKIFESEYAAAEIPQTDFQLLEKSNSDYWKKFWRQVPKLKLPNRKLTDLYRNNLRIFGSATAPGGLAAGLQGPFLEDNRVPPYGADYHFNVNTQMIYAPAVDANLYGHLKPLLDMLMAWKPILRENAWRFAGISNGYLLPHATDDCGKFMGWGFWSGMIDFAAGAWVADMLWKYVWFSGDVKFLRQDGFDFMQGCMNICYAVLERRQDGTLILPVSVSPEFHGSELSSVGSNASYQLAAMHRLARDLVAAAKLLNQTPEPFWVELMEKLPDAAVADGPHGGMEVAVFDDIKLSEGHRHHSHLGGLWPFATLPADDERIKRAYISWILNGAGTFLGWSFSWAARLYIRLGYAKAAEHTLEILHDFFTNHGHLPTGLSRYRGISGAARPGDEMMQLDCGMDAVGALLDMFREIHNGEIKLLHSIPENWENFSVNNLSGGYGVCIQCVYKNAQCIVKISLRNNQPFLLKLPAERFGRWKSLSGLTVAPDNSCRIESMKNMTLVFAAEKNH